DRHARERNDYEGLADVELEDAACQDVVDGAGLVQVQVVDVDVEEHEAGPCCCELRPYRDTRVLQGADAVRFLAHVLLLGSVGRPGAQPGAAPPGMDAMCWPLRRIP